MTRTGGYELVPTLAACSDPEQLVPGSVDGLHADADELTAHARALVRHADDLRRSAPQTWTGESANGWSATRRLLADVLAALSDAHATASAVLRVHAETLAWGRGRAALAVAVYARGCALTAAAGLVAPPLVSSSLDDPGAAHRDAAEELLRGGRLAVSASGTAAEAVLDSLCDGLPDGRWHADDFVAGVSSWLTGLVTAVWRFSALRALADGGGYGRDLRADAGAAQTVWDGAMTDPVGTGSQLLDLATLHDRPAEWWGRLAPDVALTVAGFGAAGAVTRGVRGLSAVDDVVDTMLSTAARGSGARLAMNMSTVDEIAGAHGIDISDVVIRIEKSRIGHFGSTGPDGAVALTREAFANEEQLARTLAHERFHVDQIRSGMGYPETYSAANAWESTAQAFEEEWWASR